ncbi:BID domain-containing T4SS effector [Bartonella sp. cb54]|uniref:BID domain-containing T4SS effector n=1 Tax=Bartonella sp. cb54 TaxID=3385560 RepID=UPI0039A43BAD
MLKAKEVYTGHAANYFYTRSKIPKNKYGIKKSKDLNKRWLHDAARAITTLEREPFPRQFSSEYLKYIHYSLFRNTFDWAGKTRNMPTTLEDGTLAFMMTMEPAQSGVSFASHAQIEQELKQFDQMLVEKNNLQNLSRIDFINNVTHLFTSLNHIYPFVAGGEHTERIFFENLAENAGHKIDFSVVTKTRMHTVSLLAAKYGDLTPMKEMFEDISHPAKMAALQEFMKGMIAVKGEDIHEHLVLATKENSTYQGIYQGVGDKSFSIMTNDGTYIVGLADQLTPEQRKTLKPGDMFIFTTPMEKDIQNTLIPKETLAPLTTKEIAEKIAKNPTIQTLKQEIQNLSQTVYGNKKVLDQKLESINQDPNANKQLPNQIAGHPQSFHRIAGICAFGFSTTKYQNAQECVWGLSQKVETYIEAVNNAKREMIKEHKAEQQRRGQQIEVPSKALQEALSSPKEIRQETLQASPALQKELSDFIEKINNRLSVSEHKAISYKEYGKLIVSVGISEEKVKEIVKTVTHAKEAHQQQQQQQQAQAVKLHRSQALSMAN